MKKEVFHVYKDTEKHYPTNLDLFLSTSTACKESSVR